MSFVMGWFQIQLPASELMCKVRHRAISNSVSIQMVLFQQLGMWRGKRRGYTYTPDSVGGSETGLLSLIDAAP